MIYYTKMKRQKDTKILNAIGDKLKAARLEKDLTQLDVAKKAGINGNYYAKVERGEASLSVITLLKLVKALDLESSDILPY